MKYAEGENQSLSAEMYEDLRAVRQRNQHREDNKYDPSFINFKGLMSLSMYGDALVLYRDWPWP